MKKDVVAEDPKTPHTKPTLTKHKPLRDIITAGSGSLF
jgi:hypothetical protein